VSALPPIAVHYADGIFLPELDLWLDPHRAMPQAFVSHAHSDHFARHEWTLCSEVTGTLIQKRYGHPKQGTLQLLTYREPLDFASHTLRLLPAGHIFGSAMLHVTRKSDGVSLLYTGDFKMRHGLTAEPAETMKADTLILETTFGLPHFCFPPQPKVIADILQFVRETLDDGGIPVLLGYSLGKAQEVLSALSAAGVPIMLHSTMLKLTEAYRENGQTLPEFEPFKAESAAGHVLILPPSSAKSQAIRKLKVCRTAMLSGWALTPGAKFRYQVDEVFPLSDHADYPELLQCVEQVQPRLVYTVHGSTREFAQDLRSRGYEAWSLISDDQLELTLPAEKALPVPVPVSETPSPIFDLPSPNTFSAWVATVERVAATSSRLQKQEHLATYLQALTDEDLLRAVRWLAGNLEDPTKQARSLNVGWAIMRRALLELSGLREAEYRAISRSQNDAGRTAYLVLQRSTAIQNSKFKIQNCLSLSDISSTFDQLRQVRGPTEKSQVLKEALHSLPALEGSYLVRLLTGELRIGSREGLVEEAVAMAFAQPAETLREASMLCGDLGKAALLAKAGTLDQAQPALFVPIKVMLASPEETAEDIWQRLSGSEGTGTLWLEDKYDGIRAQLHRSHDRAEIYTRDHKLISPQFPEIIAAASQLQDEVILDGELVAYAEDKKLTFHDLQKRLGRRDQGDLFISSDITVKYVIFDVLWKNQTGLLREPLHLRRQHLEALALPSLLESITVQQVTSAEEVETAFHAARRSGNEGLIAKDRTSLYTPGRRGKTWLKLKKAFSTLDVVVVKAEQGHGKRSHVLSDYTFAVRDEHGALRVIGKAYSGLTDVEIEELTEHFKEHTLSQRGNVRTVTPNLVLEIAFDSIQASARHDSGLAMRFPRIKAIRRDKTPDEIDSLDYAKQLAGLTSPSAPPAP
jgi:DNA ligase 1